MGSITPMVSNGKLALGDAFLNRAFVDSGHPSYTEIRHSRGQHVILCVILVVLE